MYKILKLIKILDTLFFMKCLTSIRDSWSFPIQIVLFFTDLLACIILYETHSMPSSSEQKLNKADILQGFLAFYKGFLPNFSRLGSWNVIMFLTLEQVRP